DLIVQHDGLDEKTVGYQVLRGLEPQYPPSIGPMWNSNMIIPIMQKSGFEVSNEQMEKERIKEAGG
ncbi:MAG: hypothetical protein GY706_02735, partial [Bacteroides sp.]|nr:hypothetical protein [Bacteroides sp.]